MEIFSFPLDTDLELVQYTLNNVRDVWIIIIIITSIYIYIYIYIYTRRIICMCNYVLTT